MGSGGSESWTGPAEAAWAGAPPPEVEQVTPEESDNDEALQYPVLPQQRTDEKDFSAKVSELFDDLVSDMNDGFASQPDVRISRLGDEDAVGELDQKTVDILTGDADTNSDAAQVSSSNQRHRLQGMDIETKKAKVKCDITRRVAMRAAGEGRLADIAAYERAVSLYEKRSYTEAEVEYVRATKREVAHGTVEDVSDSEEVATEGYKTQREAQSEATAERVCVTLAAAAAAAFSAAGKLTRVDTTGPKPSSTPIPPGDRQPPGAGQGGGMTGGGGGAGYDHQRPSAVAKYRECVSLYTKALQQQGISEEPNRTERAQYFSARAEARIRLEHFSAAVADCNYALNIVDSASPSTDKRRRRAASMMSKLQRRSDQTAAEVCEALNKQFNGDADSDKVLAAVNEFKAKGNAAFKAKQWSDAAEAYRAGLTVMEKMNGKTGSGGTETGAADMEIAQVLRNLHGNHAAALLNLDDWAGATAEATAAVACDHMWNKGHYRLGCALEGSADDDISHGLTRYATAIKR